MSSPPDIHADAPPLPRGLLFLGALWLVGSWILSLGVRPPLQPSAASYTPGVRSMLVCTAIGLTVAWPLLRLSEPRSAHPVRRAVLDMIVLAALVQIVVWPLRLVTPWNLNRTLAIDATLLSWTALVGAIVAVGGRFGSAGRTMAMTVVALLVVMAPAIAALTVDPDRGAVHEGPPGLAVIFARLSPISATHILTEGGSSWLDPADVIALATAASAAVAAWAAVGVLALRRR